MYKNKLNQIKVVLGLEVKLAADKLTDGTSIEAEEYSPGYPIFTVGSDGTKSPLAPGEYETAGGLLIEVDETGKIISSETKAEETADTETEGADATEMASAKISEPKLPEAQDVNVPASETPDEIAKKQAAVNQAMTKMVAALEEMGTEMAKMKTKMAEMEAKYQKFSKTPGGAKAPKVTYGEDLDTNNPLDAKIAALNNLKKEGFFKTSV